MKAINLTGQPIKIGETIEMEQGQNFNEEITVDIILGANEEIEITEEDAERIKNFPNIKIES